MPPSLLPTNPPSFTAPPIIQTFTHLLFDMDGTIIDSTPAIVKYWMALGAQIGVPGENILKTSHGRRSIDVLAILAPEKANWDFVCAAEGQVPKDYGDDAVEVPGARKLLEALEAAKGKWAIVTSGTRPLVTGWLRVLGLTEPKVLVTAEEVNVGKPDSACYLLGAKRLGFEGKGEEERGRVLVLEDAPAGVRAGKAAGFRVLGLATTHEVQALREAGADWVVRDLESVTFLGLEGMGMKVEIRDAVVL